MKTIKEILDFIHDEIYPLENLLLEHNYKDSIERMVIEGKIEAFYKVFNNFEYEGYMRYEND